MLLCSYLFLVLFTMKIREIEGCGFSNVDVLINFDQFTDITEEDFEKLRQFSKDIVDKADIDIGSVKMTVLYCNLDKVSALPLSSTSSEMKAMIDRIPYINFTTLLEGSCSGRLIEITQHIFGRPDYGERPNATNVAFMITSGECISQMNREQIITDSEKAKANGISIYAVGIGLNETQFLEGMASDPSTDYAFVVKNFDGLAGLLDIIFKCAPPTADAGDDEEILLPVNYVWLDGSSSSDDVAVVKYQWMKKFGRRVTLEKADTARLYIKKPKAGEYVFTLTVIDSDGQTDDDDVKVTVIAPLVADAGNDLKVLLPVDHVALDGSKSSDATDILKYQWEQISGGKVTIVGADTAILNITDLHPGIYNFTCTVFDIHGRTDVDAVQITATVLQCPKGTDIYGIAWDSGIPGKYMRGSCPGHSSGLVKRLCDSSGHYLDPIYNCTRPEIENIFRKLVDGSIYANETVNILHDLVNATSVKNASNNFLMIGDLEVVNKIMSKITKIVEINSTDINNITDSFVEVASNIIGEEAKIAWKVLINETGSGADAVVDKLDMFMEKVATEQELYMNSTVVAKSNLLVKLDRETACKKKIQFPDKTQDLIPEWAKDKSNSIDIACSQSYGMKSYSGIMYKDAASEVMPSGIGNRVSARINAPVMSFTYYPKISGKLESPVEITYQINDNKMEDPICTYWKKNMDNNTGAWAEDGCWLYEYDKVKNTVVCKCDHLTNFAVLMSLSPTKSSVLSMISKMGCITSMICLGLTLGVYMIFWKYVKSFAAVINVNLAITLFLAYLLFLTGIDQTNDKDLCTSVAVLLHLVYLTVFFIMLSEGLCLAFSVYKPLSTRKPLVPLLIASYVLPCMIVGISMAVVKLEGYGSTKFCWLSIGSGLIWAFVIPVLIIILINLIIIGLVTRKLCGTVTMSKKSDIERAKVGMRSILVMMPVTGVTWIFGIFSVNEDTVVFQYLFAIFNSLQGVLIFVLHCVMNKKIKLAFTRALGGTQLHETAKDDTGPQVSPPADVCNKLKNENNDSEPNKASSDIIENTTVT